MKMPLKKTKKEISIDRVGFWTDKLSKMYIFYFCNEVSTVYSDFNSALMTVSIKNLKMALASTILVKITPYESKSFISWDTGKFAISRVKFWIDFELHQLNLHRNSEKISIEENYFFGFCMFTFYVVSWFFKRKSISKTFSSWSKIQQNLFHCLYLNLQATAAIKINRPGHNHNIGMYWTNFWQSSVHVHQNIFEKLL